LKFNFIYSKSLEYHYHYTYYIFFLVNQITAKTLRLRNDIDTSWCDDFLEKGFLQRNREVDDPLILWFWIASFVAEKQEFDRFVSMSRSPVDEDYLVSLINDIVRILLLALNHELNTVIISEHVAWCVSWTWLLEHQLIFCCVRSKAGREERVFVHSIDSTQSNVVPGRDDS